MGDFIDSARQGGEWAGNAIGNAISGGVEQHHQWAMDQANVDMKRQTIQMAQEQHEQMKKEFEIGVGKASADKIMAAVKEDAGAVKNARIQEAIDFHEQIGKPLSETAIAAMKDEGYKQDLTGLFTMLGVSHPEVANATFRSIGASKGWDMSHDILDKTIGAIGTANSRLAMANVAGARLDETKNKNATEAGKDFDNNPLITAAKKSKNTLNRAKTALTGNVPITAESWNMIKQDMVNAFTSDGAATEGKVSRENIQSLWQELNKFDLKTGSIQDLRKSQPELVKNAIGIIDQVDDDYSKAIEQQATDLHDSFKESTNERVKATARNKLARYAPNAYEQRYGKPKPAASPTPTPTPAAAPEATPPAQGDDSANLQKAGQLNQNMLAALKANPNLDPVKLKADVIAEARRRGIPEAALQKVFK